MTTRALRISLAAIFIIAIGAIGFQLPQPPPYEGDGNPAHDGQPKFCINVDTDKNSHNCNCKPMVGDPECKDGGEGGGGESPKCRVYCRPKSCRCLPSCGHTE